MDDQTSQGESNKKANKPKIDPWNLLECLKPLLNIHGGIKNMQSVHRLVGLMGKYSKKLVSKCMYLNILLATDQEILDMFFRLGGWKMVSEWLCEGIEKANWSLVSLVLELLEASPITLARLNDSDLVMVKQVKGLSVSCPHPGVTKAAKLLVVSWTQMLTAATSPGPSTSSTDGGQAPPSSEGTEEACPPKDDSPAKEALEAYVKPAEDKPSDAVPSPAVVKMEDGEEEEEEADPREDMCQTPILPKYIPTKKPKLKNRSKFAVAKRFKSKSGPTIAECDEETLVVQHVPPVLVLTPQARSYIQHITGVGGRPGSGMGGRRGRRKERDSQHARDSSSGDSECRSGSPQKGIKITIRSGMQVLAQVSSKKSGDEGSGRALSKEFIDTDEDDDDEDERPIGKANKRANVESDEDFVVEEWTDKPVAKSNKGSEASLKGSEASETVKRPKKRIRAIIIDSDDSLPSIEVDSVESLPDIELDSVKKDSGSLKSGGKESTLVNGDVTVPVPPPSSKIGKVKGELQDHKEATEETNSKEASQPIKLKKFSVSKVESSDVKLAQDDKDKNKHSSKKSFKDKDKDKERRSDDRDKSKLDKGRNDKDDKRKDKERERKVSGSQSKERDREKEREREKRKEKERRERKEREKDQLQKDKSTMEKVKPLSTDGLAKIPKKTPSFLDALGSADTEDTLHKGPPIKVKSSSFRSTGLLDPTPPKPAGVAGKRVLPPSANGTAPRLKTKADILPPKVGKRPLDLPLAGGADKRLKTTTSSTPLTGDRPGGAKLISPKRPSLSDDGGFMAALDACAPRQDSKRPPKSPTQRRPPSRRPSDSEKGGDTPDPPGGTASTTGSSTGVTTATSATAGVSSEDLGPPSGPAQEGDPAPTTPTPLNFYKDSLEDLEPADGGRSAPGGESPPTDPAGGVKEGAAVEDPADGRDDASPDAPFEKVEVTFAGGDPSLKSALAPVRKGGPKKSVRFRPEDALEQIHYFELDETERVNVNAQKFQDMLLLEKHAERDALDRQRGRHQTCVQLGPWQLLPVHLPEGAAPAVVPGCRSLERHLQEKRVFNSMPAFFPPNRLPDTPQEPDPDPSAPRPEPPKEIPLNDIEGQDNVKNLKHIPWPDPVPNPPPVNPFYPRHPQTAPHWPRPMGGPPPSFRPNGDPEFFGPPIGGAGEPPMGAVGGAPMGGPSGGGGMNHWVVGGVGKAAPPHPMTKGGDGPMFPPGGGGGPIMPGPPGGYPHAPMPPMPHPGYGPPPGGGWGGRMDEGERGPHFRDGGWWRGGGPRGRGWGRGGRPVSKTPCRHFLKGACRNGDDCGFAHTLP